ncbi:MAG TPA: AAA family ATPase [Pyrinomonadaceae bacterium]|jgi:ATP/maltotriose-dependent transcriptional regulator MalT
MGLILDKITPPVELPRISRRRLLDALHESMTCCTSTVIHGRTGTGKTMLATDFAVQSDRRVAWYKVDAPEVDRQTFVQYLVAAVRNQHPGFGRKTLALLSSSDAMPDAALLAESFVYEMTMLEAEEPLLVVIDDLHLLYDAEWIVPFFGRLLPLLPVEAHMILIGRTLPPAPLWRMRSKQTLRVIDESALAFTLAEAEALFDSYGLPAKPAAQALAETWGRAAALDRAARTHLEALRAEEARQPVAALNSVADGRAAQSRLRLVKGYLEKSSVRAG